MKHVDREDRDDSFRQFLRVSYVFILLVLLFGVSSILFFRQKSCVHPRLSCVVRHFDSISHPCQQSMQATLQVSRRLTSHSQVSSLNS